jgi:hypothetical protein
MSGTVDQSGSMLSDDVAEKGYALLCMAMPTSDCKIMTVSEVSHTGCCAVHLGFAQQRWGCGAPALP